MKIYVDQSGKIEDTAKPTVLAWANGDFGSVLLNSREKRKLQEFFRRNGAPKLFVDYVFAVLLIFLLKKSKFKKVCIDLEYTNHERIIESLIDPEVDNIIAWGKVGKSSRVHDIAYKVFAGKIRAGKIVRADEVWNLSQRIGVFLTKKRTGGRLKIGLSPTNRRSAPVTEKMVSKKSMKVKIKK